MAKYIKKKKTLRQRTTNPETSDIRENKIILIKKEITINEEKVFFPSKTMKKIIQSAVPKKMTTMRH